MGVTRVTRQDVEVGLAELIEGDIIHTREGRLITIDDFVARFSGAQLTHESLIQAAHPGDGWHDIFDEWKGRGIIS
jgi:hypothetical protein